MLLQLQHNHESDQVRHEVQIHLSLLFLTIAYPFPSHKKFSPSGLKNFSASQVNNMG